MRNNNRAVLGLLTKKSFLANQRRNRFLMLAVVLTTLLLAGVFSVGMSFLASIQMQEIRFMGTVAHTALTKADSHQIEVLKSLPYVKSVGTGNHVATIRNTQEMGNMNLSLHYFDPVEWEVMRSPAYTDINGDYPRDVDEIMVPQWVLAQMGIDNPVLGMEIALDYFVSGEDFDNAESKVFRLSGWFTSYVHIRSGNIDSVLVSKEFSEELNRTVQDNGAATIIFAHETIDEYSEQLYRDISFLEDQELKIVPRYDTGSEGLKSSLIAIILIVFFLIFSGYLLIYNVLYISVSQDVRFYGLLKTVGTTPKQIFRIVVGQSLRICIVGIPIGLSVAYIFSILAIPYVIETIGTMSTGTVVSFSPLIYIFAALFALLTAFIGSLKPAIKAAKITPIEAQKFTGIASSRTYRQSAKQIKYYRMALRNIFRERKRACIVFLSLFLGMTTFMTILTLVSSMSTDNYVEYYMDSDFELNNNTLMGINAPKQKFDSSFIESLESLQGITDAKKITREWMRLEYSSSEYEDYIADYGKKNNDVNLTEVLTQFDFTGFIIGIEPRNLADMDPILRNAIDLEAFGRGEIALIVTDNKDLFNNVEEITVIPMEFHNELGIIDRADRPQKAIRVEGYIPQDVHFFPYSLAPTILVSNTCMANLYGDPIIERIEIEVEKEYQEQALDNFRQLVEEDYEISLKSKIEAKEAIMGTKIILYVLGGGVASLLALIGVMNFINVMSIGIMVRRYEFATLECVGMSKKEVKRMLFIEGCGYGFITILLVLTVGNGITYGLFYLFQQEATYAVFTYPLIPVLLAMFAIMGVCLITPRKAYKTLYRHSLVERLKITD